MTARCIAVLTLCWIGVEPGYADAVDRDAAQWVLSVGGRVAIYGDPNVIRSVPALPDGDFRLETVDLLGTLIEPGDLVHLSKLRRLKSLVLPGPMWNPVAGDKRDGSIDLGHLRENTSLEKFQLGHTFNEQINISDPGLARLAPLENLIELRLKLTKVTGTTLTPFRKLRRLDLTHTQTNNAGLLAVSSLHELETLYLSETKITDEGLKHLRALSQLAVLELDSTAIGDDGLAQLAGMRSLRRLSVLGADVTDSGLSHLAGLKELEELNVYRTKVTNAGLAHLTGLTKLREIDLRYTRANESGAAALKAALPKCQIILTASSDRPRSRPVSQPPAGASPSVVAQWIGKLGGAVSEVEINLAGGAVRDNDIAHLGSL
ncbi:MAG: leucine-rich repeat domain-containing protein, partial [Bryobacteraceae bacterium]